MSESAVQRVVEYFESLTPKSAERIPEFYVQGAYFKDPFNEVRGRRAIQHIFEHMFKALHEPRFVVTGRVVQGAECFLIWDFKFRFKRFDTRTEQTVRGTSHLKLSPDGKINFHRDYWDTAEELYEKLPWLGSLMRWLKKRANS
jgi:steroid Delta-isomerase